MASLRDFFDTDFTTVLNVANSFHVQDGVSSVDVIGRVHLDFTSNTTYLSCYIPECEAPSDVCRALIESTDKLLDISSSVEIHSGYVGERMMFSRDLKFSGRLFIYSETPVSETDLDHLQECAKVAGKSLQYRGQAYAKERSALEKPLAFISHDARDKDAVARPIAVGLTGLMCPVWFDEFTLKVGDRLRESIERGIRECNKCVLVLSPNFLSNPGWTKTEFNSVFTRELVEGTDLLLPVWYGVNKKHIFDYSPTLVDRLGVNWDLGKDEVVRRLCRAIRR